MPSLESGDGWCVLPPKKRLEEEMRPSTVPGTRKFIEKAGVYFASSSVPPASPPSSLTASMLKFFASPDESTASTLQRKNLNAPLTKLWPHSYLLHITDKWQPGSKHPGKETPALDKGFANCRFMGRE